MALPREFDFNLSVTQRGGIFGAWVMFNLTSRLPALQFTFKGDLVTHSSNTLFYIHDPMCSWCWGFRPVWQKLKSQFTHTLDIVYVVGGLAPDSDQPMPLAMQNNLSNTWQHIQQHIPGIEFNYEFWNPASNSVPRRSTYPACRAVLAAKVQDANIEDAMILGIQRAYYLNAKNPSDVDVLSEIANSIGLNVEKFKQDINSPAIELLLKEQLQLARQLSSQGFPSLVISKDDKLFGIPLDYNNSATMQQAIINVINIAK